MSERLVDRLTGSRMRGKVFAFRGGKTLGCALLVLLFPLVIVGGVVALVVMGLSKVFLSSRRKYEAKFQPEVARARTDDEEHEKALGRAAVFIEQHAEWIQRIDDVTMQEEFVRTGKISRADLDLAESQRFISFYEGQWEVTGENLHAARSVRRRLGAE